MGRMAKKGLQGLRVVALTSRRGDELGELVRRQGGDPLVVPVVAEVPLDDTRPALAFAGALLAGEIDVVIILTGGGVRLLADVIERQHPRAAWLAALARTTVVARSGKPAAALRGLGGPAPQVVARAPHTAVEILAALDGMELAGRHVAIQEYGEGSPELLAGLTAGGPG